jgi:predicted secreted protein
MTTKSFRALQSAGFVIGWTAAAALVPFGVAAEAGVTLRASVAAATVTSAATAAKALRTLFTFHS